jgi:hypothetical protein
MKDKPEGVAMLDEQIPASADPFLMACTTASGDFTSREYPAS